MNRELFIQRAAPTVVVLLASMHPCFADFQHISIEYRTTIQTGNGPREVWRFYARFNAPGDELYAWGSTITAPIEPLQMRTVFCTTFMPGNAFYNPQGGSITAPSLVTIKDFPLAEFDSFVTLGVSFAEQGASPPGEYPDGTLILPGFTGIPAANSMSTEWGYVWTAENAAVQGRADYAADGDLQWRVLMMQVSIRPDNLILYTIPLLSYEPDGRTSQEVLGPFTNDVLLPPGRCCLNSGACTLITETDCITFGGTFLGCQPCETCVQACVGDVSPSPGGDNQVNIDDLVAVITSWGRCPNPPYCQADIVPFQGDGLVNIDDLVAVITSWGKCTP